MALLPSPPQHSPSLLPGCRTGLRSIVERAEIATAKQVLQLMPSAHMRLPESILAGMTTQTMLSLGLTAGAPVMLSSSPSCSHPAIVLPLDPPIANEWPVPTLVTAATAPPIQLVAAQVPLAAACGCCVRALSSVLQRTVYLPPTLATALELKGADNWTVQLQPCVLPPPVTQARLRKVSCNCWQVSLLHLHSQPLILLVAA